MGISVATEKPDVKICFACMQPFVLTPKLHNTCDACRMFMKAGIICIGVTNDTPPSRHADGVLDFSEADIYRSGNFCVATEDRLHGVKRGRYADDNLRRYVFIRDAEWLKLGLPRAGKSGASQTRKGKYEPQEED
jgi:hypothetical protein